MRKQPGTTKVHVSRAMLRRRRSEQYCLKNPKTQNQTYPNDNPILNQLTQTLSITVITCRYVTSTTTPLVNYAIMDP